LKRLRLRTPHRRTEWSIYRRFGLPIGGPDSPARRGLCGCATSPTRSPGFTTTCMPSQRRQSASLPIWWRPTPLPANLSKELRRSLLAAHQLMDIHSPAARSRRSSLPRCFSSVPGARTGEQRLLQLLVPQQVLQQDGDLPGYSILYPGSSPFALGGLHIMMFLLTYDREENS
jgi:hypothetical protein